MTGRLVDLYVAIFGGEKNELLWAYTLHFPPREETIRHIVCDCAVRGYEVAFRGVWE